AHSKHTLHGGQGSHTAAALDVEGNFSSDMLDDLKIRGVAVERAVQVNHVQPACARVLPAPGDLRGVGVVGGEPVEIALVEAHAFAVFDIDGGEYFHASPPCVHFTKLPSRRRPA